MFGVDWDHRVEDNEYIDSVETIHRIYSLSYPKNCLEGQGSLCDTARERELTELWKVLHWNFDRAPPHFSIGESPPRILLDIDLDCFTINWGDYILVWPNEVWRDQFTTPSREFATAGITGKGFVDQLLELSGLVTIATESECCGGEAKSSYILARLNKYVFDLGLDL